MNKSIIAFGASTSTKSINKKLAYYAANRLQKVDVVLLDLNDFEMPLFSVDKEAEVGSPFEAKRLVSLIKGADGIIISFAEHNGNYAAAYKNIYDWISRIDANVWQNKPMFLMSTSPGGRGGKMVLGIASKAIRFKNKNSISEFSLPSFNQNFSVAEGILDDKLLQNFKTQLATFSEAL